MSGFLIKDFQLLRRQGRYYGMVLILAFVMTAIGSGSKNSVSFLTSYMTFMITMLSFSSFNYDEYDNGMAFLISLPSGRQDYVKAKYISSILLIFGGWFLACLLRLGVFLFRFSIAEYLEILPEEPIYLILCLAYISCSFPALIKFGAEKGRNISFLLLAAIAFGVYFLSRLGVQIPALTLLGRMLEEAPERLLLLLAAACIVLLFLSYQVSLWIMKKKEF